MASPEDLAFGQIAVERKLVTAAQVAECLEVLATDARTGVFPRSLAEVLLERGLLSQYLVKDIYRAQGRLEGFPEIAGYTLEAKIGHGGMGTVYRARQQSLDRVVAIKVLAVTLARDRAFVNRFLREARAVARLNHENIIVGIDVGKSGDHYFFAMEYVDGETVHEILRRERRLDEGRALQIARQITLALAHAHEHGLVHRDVKPGNIMVTADGTAKLCDLGLAKSIHQDGSLTQSGTTHGTPHYMSPEQARGAFDLDVRSDIYSLGATLYHMVVGDVPFTGASAAVILLKHLSESVPSPGARRPDLSDAFCHLIETMMAKKPEQRYQHPQQLLADIDRVLEGREPSAARPAAGESSVLPVGVEAPASDSAPTEAAPAPGGSGGVPFVVIGGVAGGIGVGAALMLLVIRVWSGPAESPTPPTATGTLTPPPSATVVVPPSATATVDPEAERRAAEEQQAQARLDEWRAAKTRQPGAHAVHILQLETLLERYGSTSLALTIADLLARERAAFAAAAEGALQAARERRAAWIAELRYGEAIEAFETVAAAWPGTEAAREANREALQLREERTGAWVDLASEAQRLEAGGELRAAMAVLQRIGRLGLPDATAEADAEIARLVEAQKAEAREAEERARREARDNWLEHSGDLLERLRFTRNYASTLAEFAAAAEKPAFERVQAWIQRDMALLTEARTAYEAAVAALRRRIGQTVKLRQRRLMHLLEGRLTAIEGGRCRITLAGGAHVELALVDLAWEDVLRLAGVDADAGRMKRLEAALRCGDGELEAARLALEQAARAGEPVGDHVADLREREAWGLFDGARGAWIAKGWAEALDRLRQLRARCGDTQVWTDHADVVQQWMGLAPDYIEQDEAVARLDTPEGRAMLGAGFEWTVIPSPVAPARARCSAAHLGLGSLPLKRPFGNPEAFLVQGTLDDAPWQRVGTGLHGPVGTRLVLRPSWRGNVPLAAGVAFVLSADADGPLFTVADPLLGGVAGSAPLTVALDAGGSAVVVREQSGGAEPTELLRLDGLALADGASHHIGVVLGEGRVALSVDGGTPREAPALSRAAGHVVLEGRGDALGFRALDLAAEVEARWILTDPWVREKLGR